MKRRRWIWVGITSGLAITVGLISWRLALVSPRAEVAAQRPDPKLERRIHQLSQEVLHSNGYSLWFEESRRCHGALVVKDSGFQAPWRVAVAWHDFRTDTFTEVVTREEILEGLKEYVVVDPRAMTGARPDQGAMPLFHIAFLATSGEDVWLRFDAESCGARSGWLEHVHGLTGQRTRRRVTW